MGQYEFDRAREAFARLASAHTDRPELHLNVAIATLNRQRDGDDDAARRILEAVLASRPDEARGHFGLGLLLLNDGNAGDALPHFKFVADRDKSDAFAVYFAARCRSSRTISRRRSTGYQRALALDPHLRSAAYGAFRTLQRLGRTDEAQQMLDVFRDLETNPQAQIVEFKYTRMGRLAEVGRPIRFPAPERRDRPVRSSTAPSSRWPNRASYVATFRRVPSGEHHRGGHRRRRPDRSVHRGRDRRSGRHAQRRAPQSRGGRVRARHGAPAGGGARRHRGAVGRLRQRRPHRRLPVSSRAPISSGVRRRRGHGRTSPRPPTPTGGGGTTVDGALFDADHDGDLDLLLIKRDGGDELLNNNGDGTFRSLGSQIGLTDPRPSTGRRRRRSRRRPRRRHHPDRARRRRTSRSSTIARGGITATRRFGTVGERADHRRPSRAISTRTGASRSTPAASNGIARWCAPRPARGNRLPSHGPAGLAGSGSSRWRMSTVTAGRNWSAPDRRPRASGGDCPRRRSRAAVRRAGPAVAGWTLAVLDATQGPSLVAMPAGTGGAPLLWRPGPDASPSSRSRSADAIRAARRLDRTDRGSARRSPRAPARNGPRSPRYRPQSGIGQSLQPLSIGTGGGRRSISWR